MQSVKTMYPLFKCLTAHRAVMKRIESGGKKWATLLEKKPRLGEPNRGPYASWMFPNLKDRHDSLGDSHVYGPNRDKVMDQLVLKEGDLGKEFEAEYWKVDKVTRQYLSSDMTGLNRKVTLEEKKYWYETNHRMKKEYPYLFELEEEYNHGSRWFGRYQQRNIRDAWTRFKMHKMYMSDKMGAFYETMLERDSKGISLCDDVIGLINQYL